MWLILFYSCIQHLLEPDSWLEHIWVTCESHKWTSTCRLHKWIKKLINQKEVNESVALLCVVCMNEWWWRWRWSAGTWQVGSHDQLQVLRSHSAMPAKPNYGNQSRRKGVWSSQESRAYNTEQTTSWSESLRHTHAHTESTGNFRFSN